MIKVQLIILIITIYLFNSFIFAQTSKTKEDVNKIITLLNQKYSIAFVYDTIPGSTWTDVTYSKTISKKDYKELLIYLRIFNSEFNKYPIEFITQINLKIVAFVRQLKFQTQARSALPDSYKEILYVDIAKGKHKQLYSGNRTKNYIRHIIHHEIYHLIEQEFNGTSYFKDTVWNSLNSPENKYGEGGASMNSSIKKKKTINLSKKIYKITNPSKGIVTIYASSALEEDKAEIYASLFIKKELKKIIRYSKKDKYIEAKVNYMKNFLFKISKTINSTYWKTQINN